MITLVGVGHAFPIQEQVKHVIFSRHPQVVCLELDALRLRLLQNPDLLKGKRGGLLMRGMLLVERRISTMYGVSLGDEMLAGYSAAQNIDARVALIDRDIRITQQRLLAEIGIWERIKLSFSVLAGLFVRQKQVEKAMRQVSTQEEQILAATHDQFPALARIIIDERNEFMAHRLRKISGDYDNIVALVGDLHVTAMERLIEDIPHEIIRLDELRRMQPGTTDYSVSFEVPATPIPHSENPPAIEFRVGDGPDQGPGPETGPPPADTKDDSAFG